MTSTYTERELSRWHGGLSVEMHITVQGKDSLDNDGIALGAAIADLTREGWRLSSLEKNDERAVAKFFRHWSLVGPIPHGPSESMTLGESNDGSN